MDSTERLSAWTSLVLLSGVRQGNEPAAEALFARYFERLQALVRSRLSPRFSRRTDPEDVVMSVYRSFFVGALRRPVHADSRRRPLAATLRDHEAQTLPANPARLGRPPVRGQRRSD